MLYQLIESLAEGNIPEFDFESLESAGDSVTLGGETYYTPLTPNGFFHYAEVSRLILLQQWGVFEKALRDRGCELELRTRDTTSFGSYGADELFFAVRHPSGKTIVVGISPGGYYPVRGYIET